MEADMIINGVKLSDAQAMTVRVALNDLKAEMGKPSALGDDAHAKCMAEAYATRASEVLKIIHEV